MSPRKKTAPPITKPAVAPEKSTDPSSSSSKDDSSLDQSLAEVNTSKIHISEEIISLPIASIEPDPDQPRKLFDSGTLANLKDSIEKNSLQNPIFIRENGQRSGHYIIVDGERRWKASRELNLTEIQCRIVTSDANGYKIVALTQNLHRDDLMPIEKANAFGSLLARLQGADEKAKQKELTNVVNLSENYISELLKISRLDDHIKEEALKSKKWSANKLLQLAKIKNIDKRISKFEEFKGIINKPPKSLDQKLGDQQVPSDSQSPANNSEQLDKQITSFISRLTQLKNYLAKFPKSEFKDSQKDQIKSESAAIQKLIKKILS
jgi:ParB/RepB/Spo0J family partition protein